MNNFKDFKISTKSEALKGVKIPIHKIFNIEVVVEDWRITESKYETENCLHLQILKGDNQHVVFTGSSVLIDTIKQIPKEKLPFKTTIIKNHEHFEFT